MRLEVAAGDAKTLNWILVGHDDGDLHNVFEGGKFVSFASAATGDYRLMLAAAANGDGSAAPRIEQHEYRIIVEGKTPDPAPQPAGPVPVPTPIPVPQPIPVPVPIPTPTPSLATWVQTNVEALVPPANRAPMSKAIATALTTWATIGGNTGLDPQSFVTGSNLMVDKLLKQVGVLDAWKPFRDALGVRLGQLQLSTVAQHVEAWKAIAQGLEAVR